MHWLERVLLDQSGAACLSDVSSLDYSLDCLFVLRSFIILITIFLKSFGMNAERKAGIRTL
jgi:hypothetical protein